MKEEIFCEYCDEELSEEKGELSHGCLRCHYDPRVYKIQKLTQELADAREVIAFYGEELNWNYDEIERSDSRDGGGKRAREFLTKYPEDKK